MGQDKFNSKDSDKLIRFLNFIADKAEFNLKVKEVVEFYGLLAWAQQELKRKIESNILEVLDVKEPEKSSKKK